MGFTLKVVRAGEAGLVHDHASLGLVLGSNGRAMDYDVTDIPKGYDRGRDHGPEVIALWMARVADARRQRRGGTILDLGCGTGRFSPALAHECQATVVGIDPSHKMLALARQKPGRRVVYVRAHGEAIPLQDGSIDTIFISMAFHRFADPARSVRECGRVLARDGVLLLRAGTKDRVTAYPYVPYFPTSVPLLLARLPSVATVENTFQAAGFRVETSEQVVQQIAPTQSRYADKLAAGGDSILASLPYSVFAEGLAALRGQAATTDPQVVSEPIDFFVFRKS